MAGDSRDYYFEADICRELSEDVRGGVDPQDKDLLLWAEQENIEVSSRWGEGKSLKDGVTRCLPGMITYLRRELIRGINGAWREGARKCVLKDEWTEWVIDYDRLRDEVTVYGSGCDPQNPDKEKQGGLLVYLTARSKALSLLAAEARLRGYTVEPLEGEAGLEFQTGFVVKF